MQRHQLAPRPDWQSRVEADGLIYHTPDGAPYWDESAYWELTAREVDVLEAATNELHARCLDAVQHVIDADRFDELHIPPLGRDLVVRSWEAEPPALYGRFDLAFDGHGPPKLLEYNADTPTALLEAAVIQWRWQQDVFPGRDQFNSIHERLLAGWRDLRPSLLGGVVHFASQEDVEDAMTTTYLRDLAEQAGLRTVQLRVEDIGWNERAGEFRDLEELPIRNLFKLYPWEWLIHEPFGRHIGRAATQWIEPAWKMVLSNKGILPILWELFPNHPNLLEAHFTPRSSLVRYVRKPLLSREGANVEIVALGHTEHASADGGYGEEGYVYQAMGPVAQADGHTAVLGSWVIQGESAGIGIRESDGPITDDRSRFVPHYFRG
ncbi:MAG: glutathionylspermidine synthase family protein [Gemmatirosa sp.]|nr:glutathionylspermidine synthase family protein [Gemmatirosa sp.]